MLTDKHISTFVDIQSRLLTFWHTSDELSRRLIRDRGEDLFVCLCTIDIDLCLDRFSRRLINNLASAVFHLLHRLQRVLCHVYLIHFPALAVFLLSVRRIESLVSVGIHHKTDFISTSVERITHILRLTPFAILIFI